MNTEADSWSRVFSDSSEWKLNPIIFKQIVDFFGMSKIDLFSSRLNKQIDSYVSWNPEPDALASDAFTLTWSAKFYYMFPPFSMGKTVAKITRDGTTGILIFPDWPTQHWYPLVFTLPYIKLMKIPSNTTNLHLVHDPNKVHPLANKMTLIALHL